MISLVQLASSESLNQLTACIAVDVQEKLAECVFNSQMHCECDIELYGDSFSSVRLLNGLRLEWGPSLQTAEQSELMELRSLWQSL